MAITTTPIMSPALTARVDLSAGFAEVADQNGNVIETPDDAELSQWVLDNLLDGEQFRVEAHRIDWDGDLYVACDHYIVHVDGASIDGTRHIDGRKVKSEIWSRLFAAE